MTSKVDSHSSPVEDILCEISDPYFSWSEQGGATDFEIQTQYLIIYECARHPVRADMAGDSEELVSPLIEEFTRSVPALPICFHPIWWNKEFLYGTATVNENGLGLIKLFTKSKLINRFEVALMPRQMRSWRGFKQPALSTGKEPIPVATTSILYGVIDHGLPFAHPGLQCAGDIGSRILSVWYQEEECSPKQGATYSGKSPIGWGFGHALPSTTLTALYTHSDSEDWRTYAGLDLPELRRDYSHGSHILGDLLEAQRSPSLQWAGFNRGNKVNGNPEYQLPDNPDTVFVQLPNAYAEYLNRSAIGAYRLSAMRYILACAGDAQSVCNKVVIPISSEDYVGSHDGTSLFEQSVDALIYYAKTKKKKELMVFFASGNSLRMRTQEKMRVLNNASQSTQAVYRSTVRIFPGNELATYVEIWMDKACEELNVEISPDIQVGTERIIIKAKVKKSQMSFYPDARSNLKIVSVLNFHLQNQQMLLVRLPPSFSFVTNLPVLPSNSWNISITSTTLGEEITAHAYIARSLNSFMRSHQSQFLQESKVHNNLPDDLLIDLPEYAKGSINGMANGQSVAVIGGYQLQLEDMNYKSERRRASYSSAGPSRPGGRLTGTAVDALAPSDESPTLRGIRHWSNRSAGSFRLAGSSVATPLAARAVSRNNVALPSKPANPDIDNSIDQNRTLFFNPLVKTL